MLFVMGRSSDLEVINIHIAKIECMHNLTHNITLECLCSILKSKGHANTLENSNINGVAMPWFS